MPLQPKSSLRRLRSSFRYNIRQTTRNLQEFGHAVQDGASLKQMRARLRRVPVWVKLLRTIYHKYGLKHVLLILVFVLYQFLGACVFLFLEEKAEEDKETQWRTDVNKNKTQLMNLLMDSFFNNTRYLFFLTPEQSSEMYQFLNDQLTNYTANYKHMTDQKIQWDFWNAMLYAGTVCTTIGYGHLFPRTDPGRFATMVYAIFGIPLVFTILDDLGKLLTLGLKYPWLGCKMLIRRVFRHCTGQTMSEIRRIDEEEKKWLPVFDLPIPVAIAVVVVWIFICSATFCIWEKNWDYFTAFYFFFVSLTTIGLGDIVPSQPKYLLMLFGYIIVGLSLVSMCVNLIQAKLERTYEAGKEEADLSDGPTSEVLPLAPAKRKLGGRSPPPQPTIATLALSAAGRVSLGVLRTGSTSSVSLPKSPIRKRRNTFNKACQTLLSIASPKLLVDSDDEEETTIAKQRHHLVPTSISLDDVMKLVDTEEADLYILSQLCGDKSEANLVQKIDNGHDQDGFMEDDWRTFLLPAIDQESLINRNITVQRQPSISSSRVHFRSSISLIPPDINDETSSFAGHVAALAQMDSSSLWTPEDEHVEYVFMEKEKDQPEEYNTLTKVKSGPPDPGIMESPSSSTPNRRWGLRFGSEKKKSAPESNERKTSLVDLIKKSISYPIKTMASIKSKHISPKSGKSLNRPTTSCSIEEEIQRVSDDDADDDRTPLEPMASHRF